MLQLPPTACPTFLAVLEVERDIELSFHYYEVYITELITSENAENTEKKKTSTNPPPRWDGAAQLIAGNSEKTDAWGLSPQMTVPSRGW